MDNFLDILGQLLWFLMLASPAVAVIIWRRSKHKDRSKLVLYLVVAICISFVLYFISLAVLFRNGLGPG